VSERTPRAWVLNLDAEHELEAGRGYTPTRHLRALVERQSRRLVDTLVAPGDVVLGEADVGERARGLPGIAWSPTARALRRLRAAGAGLPEVPDVDTLRVANERAFAARVRAPLAGESFAKRVARDLDTALASIAEPAPHGWLVRRSFGAAGRGRRRIAAGAVTAAERAWLVASLRRGPLVVEPFVEVTCEVTRSGWVRRDGSFLLTPPCFQRTTASGAWTDSERSGRGAIARAIDARLEAAAAAAAEALATAGYFGPFGVDAFTHRDPRRGGREVLNPLSEINARFTMDWGTAMSAERAPELALERLADLAPTDAVGLMR